MQQRRVSFIFWKKRQLSMTKGEKQLLLYLLFNNKRVKLENNNVRFECYTELEWMSSQIIHSLIGSLSCSSFKIQWSAFSSSPSSPCRQLEKGRGPDIQREGTLIHESSLSRSPLSTLSQYQDIRSVEVITQLLNFILPPLCEYEETFDQDCMVQLMLTKSTVKGRKQDKGMICYFRIRG